MSALELTSAQRRALRARAHALDPVVIVGGAGLSAGVAREIDRALAAHELVKVRVPAAGRDERAALLGRICDDLAAAPVQHIGKILVVYRPLPVPVGGIIITKLDSSAKGGGALAASAATGAKVMYIGTGERVDDLELFSPTRFVGRLLGMGDIQAVLDLAKRLENEADDVRLKRISSGKMNMDDFYFQLEEVSEVGSLKGFLDNMPGLSGMVKEDQVEQMETRVQRWRYIIQSMSNAEKADLIY